MRFCCVTPCLNAAPMLEETLRSVLSQRLLRDEGHSLLYVIRDGGSRDGTAELVARIAAEQADRPNVTIRFHSEPDRGMYDALAKGFAECMEEGGEVFSYLNAGDLYSPHAFEIVAEIMGRHGVHFLTGFDVTYNERGHVNHVSLPFGYDPDLFRKGYYGTLLRFVEQESTFWSGTLQRTVDLERLAALRYAGDFYLWSRFMERERLYVVSAWLGGHKVHEGQLSARFREEYRREMASLVAGRRGIADRLRARWRWLMHYLPSGVKARWSGDIFLYDFSKGTYVRPARHR